MQLGILWEILTMIEPPPTPDEPLRLQSLRRSNLLDTAKEERFGRITRFSGCDPTPDDDTGGGPADGPERAGGDRDGHEAATGGRGASGQETGDRGGGAYDAVDDVPDYQELGSDYLDKLQPQRLTHYLVKRLESLGHRVTLASVDQAA